MIVHMHLGVGVRAPHRGPRVLHEGCQPPVLLLGVHGCHIHEHAVLVYVLPLDIQFNVTHGQVVGRKAAEGCQLGEGVYLPVILPGHTEQ